MNIIDLVGQLWRSMRQLVRFLLWRKTFNYVLQMSPQDCLQRLRGLSQPKVGFVNAISQSVMLRQEERHFQFEVAIVRYGRTASYNSVMATGIITATIDHTTATIISGNISFGMGFLLYPILFLASIFLIIYRIDLFRTYFIFYILWLVFMLFYLIRDYGDYQRLDTLIHDTFPEEAR